MSSLVNIHSCPGSYWQKCGNVKSVTAEIKNCKGDKWGQPYPPQGKCYITVAKTANFNAELTIMYKKKVFFPGAGVTNSEEFGKLIGDLFLLLQRS